MHYQLPSRRSSQTVSCQQSPKPAGHHQKRA
uniref:Uncharacterized protein n=1 Tax=Arundo donax TaxID=35708 RepID=A0A0A8ZC58_ARUDO